MQTKFTVNKKRVLGLQIGLLVVLLAVVIAYFAIPAFNSKVNGIITLFTAMNVESVIGFIRSYGIYAAAISFGLMIFQSVAAPLPAFLLTFANAAIFGWWEGAILSWVSAMAGAAVCFFIARVLGRGAVEKLTGRGTMATVDGFFDKYGKHTILVCRLLPFVSFDFISYAGGLTAMSFAGFFIATGLGQLPATLVYSYVGGMLTGGTKLVVTALMILFSLSVLVVMFKKIYNDHQAKKENGKVQLSPRATKGAFVED